MSIHDPQVAFTEAEISRQAGINATGMSLGILAHAKKHGEPADSATRWLGAIFAPAWEDLRGQGAFVVLRLAALNAVSVGGRLQTLSGDEHRAEGTVGEWPTDANLDFFGRAVTTPRRCSPSSNRSPNSSACRISGSAGDGFRLVMESNGS